MRKRLLAIMVAALFVLSACTSQKKLESDDDFSVDAENSAAAKPSSGSDDLSLDGGDSSAKADKPAASTGADELELDSPAPKAKNDAAKPPAGGDTDLALESELNSLDGNKTPAKPADTTAKSAGGADELSLDDNPKTTTSDNTQAAKPPAAGGDLQAPQELSLDEPKAATPSTTATTPPNGTEIGANAATTPPPPAVVEATPPPVVAPIVDAQTPPTTVTGEPVTINSVQYKANNNGGTIAIGADKPLTFTTRMNPTTSQFVVEVQNASIPKKLMRSLNTKDMASSIGSVDIYQRAGSNVARFVVQLRAGSGDPVVQQEGNSLLIIGPGMQNGSAVAKGTGSATGGEGTQTLAKIEPTAPKNQSPDGPAPIEIPPESAQAAPVDTPSTTKSVVISAPEKPVVEDVPAEAPSKVTGLLNYENLEQFLMSNTKYYGKKVSIETSGMEVTDALKFLSEESGVNIIFDDSVNGKVNIKLREVPWDQAFVLILKSKKLVYKRMGNVIRVARYDEIKKDEDEAIALKEARKVPEPIAVKRFFIGYADLEDTSRKIEDYIKTLNAAATAGQPQPAPGQAQPVAAPAVGKVIVDKRNNTLIVTDTESNLKKVEDLVAAIDMQPRQVLIEAKILTATDTFQKGLGVKWLSSPTAASGAKPTSGQVQLEPTKSAPGGTRTDFNLGVTWGQLDFLGSLNAVISLGEQENKAKVLSSPRITVISSQQATIQSDTDLQVNLGTTTTTTGTTTNFKTVATGVVLKVTPTATNQGTVNLKLDLQKSDPNATKDGAAKQVATTELFVKSGTTAVIGGIYQNSTSNEDAGTPGLRKIPILGALFQSNSVLNKKEELIMFVTPTILKPL